MKKLPFKKSVRKNLIQLTGISLIVALSACSSDDDDDSLAGVDVPGDTAGDTDGDGTDGDGTDGDGTDGDGTDGDGTDGDGTDGDGDGAVAGATTTAEAGAIFALTNGCLLYTSPSPRDRG